MVFRLCSMIRRFAIDLRFIRKVKFMLRDIYLIRFIKRLKN